MATAAVRQEVDELREFLKDLSYQSMRTELSVNRLSQEMREFKEETRRDRKRLDKQSGDLANRLDTDHHPGSEPSIYRQWGDLANRLGTLVEDIVAPNLPRAAVELFGCEHPSLFAVRVVRHWQGETREYDALVVCDDAVLVNETKSKLLAAHVDAFCAKLEELPRVFPEYANRRVVGVLASLAVDAGVVAYATRCGVAVLAMGEDTMQIVNPEAVRLGV